MEECLTASPRNECLGFSCGEVAFFFAQALNMRIKSAPCYARFGFVTVTAYLPLPSMGQGILDSAAVETVVPADLVFQPPHIEAPPEVGTVVPAAQFLNGPDILDSAAVGTIVPAEQFFVGPDVLPLHSLSTQSLSRPASLSVAGETDSDGDGRVGAAEDADGDAVYGSFGAAWQALLARGGGEISITRSGDYPVAALAPVPVGFAGIVTISAASGVSATLSGAGGIGLDVGARVVVRGVKLRGFATGVAVRGGGSLLLDNSVIDGCSDFGVHVAEGGTALIRDCSILSTGVGALRPAASIGVCFERASSGQLRRTAIWEGQGAGLVKRSTRVRLYQLDLHHNRRDVGR